MPHRSLQLILALSVAVSACATRPRPPATGAPNNVQAGSELAQWPADERGVSPASQALQAAFAQAAGDRVFFDTDQHDLTAEARGTLARQLQWLRGNPRVLILVTGNCDERGTREYNLALGAQRAGSVRAWLLGNGISAERMRTVSYGKERPLAEGVTEAAWAQNRNAQTILIDATGR